MSATQSKQVDETLFICRQAAANLNDKDGKQNLKVLLPELECLQALAETAIAHEELGFGSDKEALAYRQEAVKLFPDSPVTHYYLGDALSGKDPVAAKASYRKAAELGDDGTRAVVNERLGVAKSIIQTLAQEKRPASEYEVGRCLFE